jgi:type IV pilus assembly protein PilC
MQRYGLVLLAFFIGVGVVWAIAYSTPKGRYVSDRMALRMPVIGSVLSSASMAHFGGTLSLLLNSGITLIESLRVTAEVIGNRAVAQHIRKAANQILEGATLTEGTRSRIFPDLVNNVIAVGEQTGELGRVLDEVGEFYDRHLQMLIRRMSALVEPVMILLVGGMVGFVYFAFFQAAFQLALVR